MIFNKAGARGAGLALEKDKKQMKMNKATLFSFAGTVAAVLVGNWLAGKLQKKDA